MSYDLKVKLGFLKNCAVLEKPDSLIFEEMELYGKA